MKKVLLAFAAFAPFALLLTTARAATTYAPVAEWLKLPEGRAQLGNQHGDVAVSSAGEVYVSVQDPAPLMATALGLMAQIGNATAQTAADLVGTWTNIGNVNVRADGTRAPVFGPKGTGLAIFDASGRFVIININPDTPKFAANNRAQGTAEENKAAVNGGIALYGTNHLRRHRIDELRLARLQHGDAGAVLRRAPERDRIQPGPARSPIFLVSDNL